MGNFEEKCEVSHALVAAARLAPHQVKWVRLSKTQLKVLDSIKQHEEVTAQLIAKRCDLSPSWASSLLRSLYLRCYLTRVNVGLDFGGVEFRYRRLVSR
ncbi:MarR family transcriptional regulator [Vibrio crassostreae]|nr:MarR family transcriptional regulator [Vibrio crassostreae]CAK1965117.1 MarR family transcriptional regulator [Vibrio crassostreae]CAK2250882.1 MarR family transcriptional regulator [Vibrio crassostreae]CAK2376311.1 MarR family transcriptional regulator [Vibrio crassostreae]CAK2837492.1 MarR family transcriptional regulator [Vibrio crassostreae]